MEKNIEGFVITKENRGAIGFTEDTEDLVIPEFFIGTGGNGSGTVKGQKYQVTKIAPLALSNSKKLKTIVLPSSLTDIAIDAFGNNPHLEKIAVNPGNICFYTDPSGQMLVNRIRDKIMWISPLATELIFPHTSEHVLSAYYIRKIAPKVTTVFIPSSVEYIEQDIFAVPFEAHSQIKIIIDKPKNFISGAPWGAYDSKVYWIG